MEKFTKNLRSLRLKLELSQYKLAKEIGVGGQNYSNWETGRSAPSLPDVIKLAKFHELTVDDLLGDDTWIDASVRPKEDNSNRLRIWIYCETKKTVSSGEGTFKKGKYYLEGKDVTKTVKKWLPIPKNPGTKL